MDVQFMYEGLVEEEDELVGKLTACEGFMWILLENIARSSAFVEEIGERLLTELNGMEQEWRTELLHLRLEKSLLAGKMRDGTSESMKRGDGAE